MSSSKLLQIFKNLESKISVNLEDDLKPYLIDELRSKLPKEKILILTSSQKTAQDLQTALLDETNIQSEILPMIETESFELISPKSDTVAKVISILQHLPKVLIVPFQMLNRQLPENTATFKPYEIQINQDYSFSKLEEMFTYFGFQNVDLVTARGEFAIRGSIIDIFPADFANPLRLEFFGDELEEIRQFHTSTQRSLPPEPKPISGFELLPTKLLLLDKEIRKKAGELAAKIPKYSELLEFAAQGIYSQGLEAFLPLLSQKNRKIGDFLDYSSVLLIDNLQQIEIRAERYQRILEQIDITQIFGEMPANEREILRDFNQNNVEIDDFNASFKKSLVIEAFANEQILVLQPKDFGAEIVAKLIRQSDPNYIRARSAIKHTAPRIIKNIDQIDLKSLQIGDFVVHNRYGIGKYLGLQKKEVKTSAQVSGKFFGGKQPQMEFVALEYAPNKKGYPADMLYVQSTKLDQLSKYIGADTPRINRLSGSEWQNLKKKARRSIRNIAIDLVKLYADRQVLQKTPFSKDTPWQNELEASFEFIETIDQIKAIADIKSDMESSRPMDRLLSGDVGFGKTEIAVRAAFKAIQDHKQVILLVPTTLLAKQHFETFEMRYEPYPINIRVLSRFNSQKETNEVLAGLKNGTVDLVIGTHKLLQKSIEFSDLGLIIIDEEQRFGVEHKEKLKAIRENVDVLSLSATPIPRTLEMSLTGIREMSNLTMAPEDRLPILTYVGKNDDSVIEAAIRRELMRDGQVFFVHNRISDIESRAAKIHKMIPEAKIAIAHGSLSGNVLEQAVLDFYEHKIDILLCTTIIETGLDISNANTLIVDNAQKFGLSGLHQLRGRVGRGSERAYAYFLYPANLTLSDPQYKRLKVISENNELGSGAQIAMHDLALRGAGNLLGAEQSGHINGVGFDMYIRLVSEAVENYKQFAKTNSSKAFDIAGSEANDPRTQIEIPVQAFISVDYISSESLRLEAYKKIADLADLGEISDFRVQLKDRFGKIPAETESLLKIAELKISASKNNIMDIRLAGEDIVITNFDKSSQKMPLSQFGDDLVAELVGVVSGQE